MQYQIVIDASHGGEDIGLVVHERKEKNVVLDISKYMYQQFKRHGMEVKMTRMEDTTLPLEKRITKIQESYGDSKKVIVISNHMMNQEGVDVIYSIADDPDLSTVIRKQLIQEKVHCYQKRYGLNMRQDYYVLQRETSNMQVLIIKYGIELERSNLDQNVDRIVKAVMKYIDEYSDHQTKSEDALWDLAKKFDIPVDELKELNGFYNNLLRTDEFVKLNDVLEYNIQKGENLYQIAQKFGVKIEDIMKLNHFKSNLVSVGTKIKIPKFVHIKNFIM